MNLSNALGKIVQFDNISGGFKILAAYGSNDFFDNRLDLLVCRRFGTAEFFRKIHRDRFSHDARILGEIHLGAGFFRFPVFKSGAIEFPIPPDFDSGQLPLAAELEKSGFWHLEEGSRLVAIHDFVHGIGLFVVHAGICVAGDIETKRSALQSLLLPLL